MVQFFFGILLGPSQNLKMKKRASKNETNLFYRFPISGQYIGKCELSKQSYDQANFYWRFS